MKTRLSALFLILILIITACLPAYGLSTSNMRVGFYNVSPFYIMNDYSGEAKGYQVDLIKAAAKTLDMEVTFVQYQSAAECFGALVTGEVDAVLSSDNEVKNYSWTYLSDSINASSLALFLDSDIKAYYQETETVPSDSQGGVEMSKIWSNSVFTSYSEAANFTSKQRTLYLTEQKLTRALVNDEIDFAFADVNSMSYVLEQLDTQNEFSIEYNYLGPVEYKLAFYIYALRMRNDFNKALSTIRLDGSYDQITDLWIPEEEVPVPPITETQLRFLTTAGVILVMGLFMWVVIENHMKRKLASEVEQRTNELSESVKFRNRILDVSRNGLVMVNDGKVKYVNKAFTDYIRKEPGIYIGGDSLDMPIFQDICEYLAAGGRSVEEDINPENVSIRYNGVDRIFRFSSHHAGGYGYLVSLEDVTKEETRAKMAAEADKNSTLNTLIAGIAHEIKNPLMVIQTYTSLIHEQKDDGVFLAALENTVPKETQRISKLITSLIDYAKPAKKRNETFDVTVVCNDVYNLAGTVANNYHCSLTINEAESYYIRGDSVAIRQSILNFVLNALDAVKAKMERTEGFVGHVSIEILQNVSCVDIIIKDDGEGMTAEELRSAQDPFYTTKAKGTGLGIPLAMKYISSSNGIVMMNSVKNAFTQIVIRFMSVGGSNEQ